MPFVGGGGGRESLVLTSEPDLGGRVHPVSTRPRRRGSLALLPLMSPLPKYVVCFSVVFLSTSSSLIFHIVFFGGCGGRAKASGKLNKFQFQR